MEVKALTEYRYSVMQRFNLNPVSKPKRQVYRDMLGRSCEPEPPKERWAIYDATETNNTVENQGSVGVVTGICDSEEAAIRLRNERELTARRYNLFLDEKVVKLRTNLQIKDRINNITDIEPTRSEISPPSFHYKVQFKT
jgi:hypothetical protein